MKRGLFYLFLLFIFLGVIAILLWHFNFLKLQESEVYQPSQEFKPAFEALEADSPMDNPEYDLEETVRAMNALEVAQCHSADFVSYLEYVARQDFSRVAPEVLEQKKKLFPILQRLYELQKEHKELNDVWMLMRSATSGASSFVEEVNPIGVIGSMITGYPLTGTVSVAGGVDKAQEVAFEEYEKQKDLKKSLEREMEALRLKYVEYLEGYAPIYHKYMQEWNALCLVKDKAYLDLYGGDPIDAYNRTEEILKSYPENREALLLKSLALIEIASNFSPAADSSMVALTPSFQADLNSESKPKQSISEFFVEAESTLDNYIQLYPARSAPALVLKGLLYRSLGDNAKAINFFDQASVEYPRQAAALTDLLDSYKSRAYLNSSAEGKYLLRLYRSTMEGFGIFSPNLLKAKYFAQQGDVENCKEEIFNHFFRRGNQGVYDCLLSDMQYCEENMYSSFKQILLEQSFLDVAVEPVTNWHLGDKDDEIKVVINNRSDIDLENVRIFLCLHYTDMYKDEYDVQKLPSVNIIKHNDKTEIGVVKLNYENKRYNDITRIRAIAMTDDKICWIDNVDYKYMKASEMAVKENKGTIHNFV
jgi:tetratricopeptide (TPR) repeat protein